MIHKLTTKSTYIHIRITPSEKIAIERAAGQEGLDSTSAYLLWLHRTHSKKALDNFLK